MRGDGCARRYCEFLRLRECVSEGVAREVNRVGVWVVEFEPILEKTIGWVREAIRAGIVGHPFVDDHRRGCGGRVVGGAGSGDDEDLPVLGLAIGE